MDPKDHDLLIELRTEVKGLREDFRTANTSIAAQLASLQTSKLDKDTFSDHLQKFEDHEERIRSLEKGFWKMVGALIVVQIVAEALLRYFLK
jgi:hypothetical protein